ncbi:MAG: acyclic terpene utilization AtuA family protein, partial [Sphaerochaeta sp.]|nr:acyclic terpene utilization AtuA family protein [Sphaerochaeta sp.]
MKSLTLLAPCGILGYGFPDASFKYGLSQKPDAIVVDAGSTDAGPHKLGAKTAIVSRMAAKKDLQRIILGGWKLKIPVLVGSAGGSGGHSHVEWTLAIIDEILREHTDVKPKIAIIWADIPNQVVVDSVEQRLVTPCDTPSLPLNAQIIEETTGLVAQMGVEPILRVIEAKADIIICGRAYDPAPFAAMGVYHGFDEALSYHLGKVLECGALCCNPGTTKDCMLGTLYDEWFEVYPCDPKRRCTPVSVAAHTFYEKDHPYLLHGPGIAMDLSGCTF